MQITMQTKPVSVLISAFTHSSGGRNPTCMYQTKHDQERTHLQGSQRMMSSQWGGGWFNEAAGGGRTPNCHGDRVIDRRSISIKELVTADCTPVSPC